MKKLFVSLDLNFDQSISLPFPTIANLAFIEYLVSFLCVMNESRHQLNEWLQGHCKHAIQTIQISCKRCKEHACTKSELQIYLHFYKTTEERKRRPKPTPTPTPTSIIMRHRRHCNDNWKTSQFLFRLLFFFFFLFLFVFLLEFLFCKVVSFADYFSLTLSFEILF